MLFEITSSVLTLTTFIQIGAATHGDGAEGTLMGPVAFLWPSDRPWDASQDNVGPCGSTSAPENRTNFPLGSVGSIELTIADEADNLAVRIAYGNDPTRQDAFQSIKSNVSEVEPGHQCYSMPAPPSDITAGSNATIQLEYKADDDDKDKSFFACADITFVDASTFTNNAVCFNVTASDFNAPVSTASTISSGASILITNPDANSGLSEGAKAGIAVGAIVGAALLFAMLVFSFRCNHRSKKDADLTAQQMEKESAASIDSAETLK